MKTRSERRRYYIQFSVRPYVPGRRYVWPKLFRTEQDAWDYAHAVDPFRHSQATPQRGRIISYAVQSTYLPAVTP